MEIAVAARGKTLRFPFLGPLPACGLFSGPEKLVLGQGPWSADCVRMNIPCSHSDKKPNYNARTMYAYGGFRHLQWLSVGILYGNTLTSILTMRVRTFIHI